MCLSRASQCISVRHPSYLFISPAPLRCCPGDGLTPSPPPSTPSPGHYLILRPHTPSSPEIYGGMQITFRPAMRAIPNPLLPCTLSSPRPPCPFFSGPLPPLCSGCLTCCYREVSTVPAQLIGYIRPWWYVDPFLQSYSKTRSYKLICLVKYCTIDPHGTVCSGVECIVLCLALKASRLDQASLYRGTCSR